MAKFIFITLFVLGLAAPANSAETPEALLTNQIVNLSEAQPGLSYEIKQWAHRLGTGEFEAAGHLWESIQLTIPESFRDAAEAGHLLVLYKLGLAETFLERLAQRAVQPSKFLPALEAVVEPSWDHSLESEAFLPGGETSALLAQLPDRPIYRRWRAWSALRHAAAAPRALDDLPPGHPWRANLARTVAYSRAKAGDARGALALLERETVGAADPSPLWLAAARLRYGQGSLDEAGKLYEKIPAQSPDYLSAQEELVWVWLRQGNTARVRGALQSLSLSLFEERLAPEVYVVRAISNLKLCFYGEAEKDFGAFLERNRAWAAKIESGQSAPPNPDWYTLLVDRAITRRQAEVVRLDELIQNSIAAALPAVGRQKHWRDARDLLTKKIGALEKMRAAEYRRQWKNASVAVHEAIRKMRFVKLELLAQVRAKLGAAPDSARAEVAQKAATAEVEREAAGAVSYPFDGVVWSDELFKLRSTASNRCL